METSPKPSQIEALLTVPFNEQSLARLRELSPRLHIQVETGRKADEIPAEIWSKVEILYTDQVMPLPEQAPNLRWVQFHFTGIDPVVDVPLMHKPDLLMTTLSGAAAPQVAEYAVSLLLGLGHRMIELSQAQDKADWPRERWERFRPMELRNSTVGIIGYGSLGREMARLLRPFGTRILAVKRDVFHPEDHGYTIPGLGDPGGDLFDRLYPPQALRSMMKECDFVVVMLPLTAETRGLIGAAELAVMKPSAYFVQLARGAVVDQTALLLALQERRIAGAALDVFQEEPLPNNHPLWRLNNVILSPHIAGMSAAYDERALALWTENLKRYLTGASLLNLLDVQKGY